MADIWFDVDAALSEVPVNIFPLTDDTDFKTRETGITYNQAGMDLVWNFVTTSGAYTQTAVTPTTGGAYDWAHQGDGMYSIEIPASGGASINNDTEGFGWFTGLATGVLPWRSPVFGFRAAALNNALIDGGDLLDVNVTHITDTAQTGRDIGASVLLSSGTGTGQISLSSGAVTAGTVSDKTGYTASTVSDKTGYSLSVTPPTAADIATAVWAAGTRTLSSFGSLVADIATAVWGAVARTITGGTVDTCTTNSDMRGTDSALLAANYTAPNNSGITDIKSKTDQLTFTEANKVDATATVSVAGLATEAKQDEIISDIAGVITHGDANWLTPSGIGGTIAITFNVKDDSGNNILDAVVEVWDTAGTTLKERKETNSSGNAVFNCKAETYTIKITKSGYSFDNASYTVTVPATVNYVMTAFNIPVSPDLTRCRVWMKLINTYSSLTVTADVPENLTGNNLVMGSYTGVYDTANNLVYWDLPIGALNSVLKITELGFEVVVPLILDLESSELKVLI